MFKVNEYFDGKVKSLGFETKEGAATIGIMAAGDYEFGTSTVEYMTVTSGEMKVLLPGSAEWMTFRQGDTFIVPANSKFKLELGEPASYLCLYR